MSRSARRRALVIAGSMVLAGFTLMTPAYAATSGRSEAPAASFDHFTASVTYAGSSKFTLKLSDTTQRWSHTVTKTLRGAARSSAEVIAEAPCCTASGGVLPLADFGTVPFSSSTANGSALSNFSPTGINMVSANGAAEDRVSPLSGGSFTATWLS